MIIIAGDTHLKRYLWYSLRAVQYDTFFAFEQIISYAREHNAEALILAGDIHDPITTESLKFYQEQTHGLQDRIFAIDGEHDRAEPPWISVPKINGENLDQTLIEVDGHYIWGIRQQSRASVTRDLTKIPKQADVLIMHQFLDAVAPVPSAGNLDENLIPEHIRWCFMGHCHAPCTVEIPGGRAYYTGSTVPQKCDEFSFAHSFLVFEDGKVRRQLLEGRRFYRVRCETPGDLENLVSYLEAGCPSNAESYRGLPSVLFLEYNVSLHNVSQLLTDLRAQFQKVIFHMRPFLQTQDGQAGRPIQIGKTMEELVSQNTDDPDLQGLLIGLLREGDRRPIDEFRSRFQLDLEECYEQQDL